ncbi:VCBS repeat-containing protein [uncultured Paludibaculum sp.]|uniref:FG-GAP repeat domain-containing protein n=1 Tax=uncultured Paludibaculum sp. TaxID=1765020 RepID=UPI002AABDD64|nr:VCBS repeat-containing protein [uncultured Paludibaculum sp.]
MTRHLYLLLLVLPLCGGELPAFKAHVVTSGLKMGYQLVSVDLNGDGRKDLIAVDERATELAWFENPTWERHVMAVNAPRPINMDCYDYDGDGAPECVVALHFETSPEKSIGDVYLLKSGKDVRQPWTMKELDRIPTAHRIRWIDWNGDGKKVLLLSPLVGLTARPPLYEGQTPVYLYRPGVWKRETVTEELHGIVHAIAPIDWTTHGQRLITASFDGLRLHEPKKGGGWKWTEISKGDTRKCPECGSSEVRIGKLGKLRFITAIEPWHGNQVVVYLPDGKTWKRVVIEDSMINAHALAVGDLDGDGRDEIVSGFRGKGFRVSIYQAEDKAREHWKRTILDDGGLAGADCKIEDFTGDGKPDIVCIGASTANIKLYENLRR